ncbi:cytochrome P450 2C3-like [Paramacrobiotus metropolitanus]|uniref:cytochrome P450 2C3-like n=1 Tax=Paramacrobiotus metropolitanus TaxID=2943436 RepID=UPI0024465D1B|nr:cytochrome P450 2C3-like [Paramacrobiotus metropolitanus]
MLPLPFYIVGICFAITMFWKTFRRRYRLPPGPRFEWPIVGSAMNLGSLPQVTLTNMSQQYGPVFCLHLGRDLVVVLNDYESIKKLLSVEETTGRPRNTTLDLMLGGNAGLAFSDGDLWKEHRRFALTALRDLGMGKSWLQEQILDETNRLIEALAATNEQPIDPHHLVITTISNLICATSFGKRYNYDDADFRALLRNEHQYEQQLSQMSILDLFPILRFVPPFREVFERRMKVIQIRREHMQRVINDARSSGNKDGQRLDYVNLFMEEKKRQRDEGADTTFDDEQLLRCVADLFGAGTQTTANSILFGLLLMVENPDVLRKVQAELDSVAERNEQILVEHKDHLPYTEAVIMEIQRLIPVVPLSLLHRTTAPIAFDDYIFPSNTLIIPNIYAVHHDPKLWGEAEAFSPSRFVDSDGKFAKSPYVLHFSLGKRACPGEAMGQAELFLVLANILHKFDLLIPEGVHVSSKNLAVNLTVVPNPFQLIFRRRL